MLDLHPHFISTYSKNLLIQWTPISDLIRKLTAWIKETIQEKDQDQFTSSLLSDRQINDALNGPFQAFFKSHLATYVAIAKVETALIFSKEDFFKESEHELDMTFGVPEKLLTSMEISTLKNLRDQLDDITQNHYLAWETHIQAWIETLLDNFIKNDVQLSDLEIQDLLTNQPVSELHDRFINLKLTIPKLSKDHFNFQQYFTLKTTLAIQSTLGRTQQRGIQNDVEEVLKSFQATFKAIHASEKELLLSQQKVLDQLVLSIKGLCKINF